MNETLPSLNQFLVELYEVGSHLVKSLPYEYEEDRWNELLVCALVGSANLPGAAARNLVDLITQLGMNDVDTLASLSETQIDFIVRIFIQAGVAAEQAKSCTATLTAAATCVSKSWGGHIQKLLRAHAQPLVEDLTAHLVAAGIAAPHAAKTSVLWLQNVANLPVLLPGDPHIADVCSRFGVSVDQLIQEADDAGVNVAVLDDLLAIESSLPPSKLSLDPPP